MRRAGDKFGNLETADDEAAEEDTAEEEESGKGKGKGKGKAKSKPAAEAAEAARDATSHDDTQVAEDDPAEGHSS